MSDVKTLADLNPVIQPLLSASFPQFRLRLTRSPGSIGMGDWELPGTPGPVPDFFTDHEVSRAASDYARHNLKPGIYRFNFAQGALPQISPFSLEDTTDYILQSVRKELKAKSLTKAEIQIELPEDSEEENRYLSNLTGPQGVQSKDGLPSYDLWSEMGVFCSQLEPRPRRILWTIGLEDEQFTASPPVPALGGLEAPPEGLNLHGDLKDREEAIAESQRLRLEAYQSWGDLSSDVLAPMIGPILSGGQNWPAGRPQYRVLNTAEQSYILTDGMSDCFEEQRLDRELQYNGWSIEFFMAFEGKRTLEEFQGHYSIGLLHQITQNAIRHRGFYDLFAQHGALTIEFADLQVGPEYKGKGGRTFLMMNLPARDLPQDMRLNKEKVILAGCRLLKAQEGEACEADESGNARKALAQQFKENGSHALSPWDPLS